jgi:enoyl-CoA hydratase/carnithine racemase
MTGAMYTRLAEIFNEAGEDQEVRVVVWHGAGDAFSANNDAADFLKNPPGPGESPQARLMDAFVSFEKPIVVAVQGAPIGGGTTMLTHCDVVYAGESAKFQLPFIDLALVPEFGSSYSLPERIGYLRAAELFLLGEPFDTARAAELGLVTRVVPDEHLLATSNGNGAEACSETERRTAGQQATDQAGFHRSGYSPRSHPLFPNL